MPAHSSISPFMGLVLLPITTSFTILLLKLPWRERQKLFISTHPIAPSRMLKWLKLLPKNVPTQTHFYSTRLIHSSIHSACARNYANEKCQNEQDLLCPQGAHSLVEDK